MEVRPCLQVGARGCIGEDDRGALAYRWARVGVQVKTIEVRITTIYSNDQPVLIDIETEARHLNEPLLVGFSNDKKKTKSEKKELHEIILQMEADLGSHDDHHDDDALYDDDYEFFDDYDHYDDQGNRARRDVSSAGRSVHRNRNSTIQHKKDLIRRIQQQIEKLEESDDDAMKPSRHRRQRRSLRKRRNLCRRRKLLVNFRDIKWHKWIIQPTHFEVSIKRMLTRPIYTL